VSLRKRLAELEARIEALEAEPDVPVWPKMPPKYDLSDDPDWDGVWRQTVEDYAASGPYVDEFGGYL
jgi:hypothetical protein